MFSVLHVCERLPTVTVRVSLFQNKYRAKAVESFKEYSVVTDTPVYETAKQNSQNLSDVSAAYRRPQRTETTSIITNTTVVLSSSCTTATTTTSTSREAAALRL